MPSDGGAGGDAAVHLEEEKLQEKRVGGKTERKTERKGGGHNEDRTWLANLLCKRKYGISLPRRCRRRSNRNSFQPAAKKAGLRTPD